MKKFAVLMSLVIMALTGLAKADDKIVCAGKSHSTGLPFAVEITADAVTVTGGLLQTPHVFSNLTKVNGLITAPGLAVTMENAYGCLRRATIITELREPFGAGYMETNFVATCSGGSTPDRICKPSQP